MSIDTASGAAAGDAAGAAAWDALAPTVKALQASALLLVERVIEVGQSAAVLRETEQ